MELVASQLTREARLLEVATKLAQVPGVVAGGITSYAGGAMGHDPIRVGTAAKARGLTPNIHITCVGEGSAHHAGNLEDLAAVGIENVFAITGDYPKAAGTATSRFRTTWIPCSSSNSSANARQPACRFTFPWRFRRSSTREAGMRLSVPEAGERKSRPAPIMPSRSLATIRANFAS